MNILVRFCLFFEVRDEDTKGSFCCKIQSWPKFNSRNKFKNNISFLSFIHLWDKTSSLSIWPLMKWTLKARLHWADTAMRQYLKPLKWDSMLSFDVLFLAALGSRNRLYILWIYNESLILSPIHLRHWLCAETIGLHLGNFCGDLAMELRSLSQVKSLAMSALVQSPLYIQSTDKI